jgi:hypothetical protein
MNNFTINNDIKLKKGAAYFQGRTLYIYFIYE